MGLYHQLHSRERPALHRLPLPELPACAVSVTSASPYEGVPGILFQPGGLRLSPFNQNCIDPDNKSGSILINQDSALWAHQTVTIWSPHLQEDR